ncbi:MAG: NADPH-dependent oxidoreductase [Rhizomicrobium sp.]
MLWARNRDPSGPVVGPWNDVVAGLVDHRSVRDFASTPLPPGLVETLVAAAQSAASSSNLQTWSVVAVEDPDRKVRLSVLAGNQAFIRQAPLFLVWLADLSRNERVAAERQIKLEAIDYLETLFIGIIDAALAAQNAVVALESLDLGAVYVGAIRNKPEQVAAELGLPPRVMPVFGMAVGYPDPAVSNAVKPRLPQRAVLHREQYDKTPQPEAVLHYDVQMSDFQREQNIDVIGWLGRTIPRLKSVKSLAGRDRMREALANLGFELR